jgi:N-acetylated-alpha-linked acidic dipeptidase
MFGLEIIRMSDVDILPFDYEEYGKEILVYLDAANKKAEAEFGAPDTHFQQAASAARRFEEAGAKMTARQRKGGKDIEKLNAALIQAERELLIEGGLPHRPWYRHSIYAPGEYTGYAAVVIPGVNESIDRHDRAEADHQLDLLSAALDRAARALDSGK